MPTLRILAGPSFYDLQEIAVNTGKGFPISTDVFEGQLAVYIKGFPNGEVVTATSEGSTPYFDRKEREGKSWSIHMQGRFLQSHTADDILVGAAFDYPLSLPWGFSAVTSFMQFMDRTLVLDVGSNTPSALSPLITTMPHFAHTRLLDSSDSKSFPPFPPPDLISDDLSELHFGEEQAGAVKDGEENRKKQFGHSSKRKQVTFGPEDLITADYVHGHLDLTPEGVSVQVPGGFSFDMLRYWDGRPVRFICCKRLPKGETKDGMPWGRVFWCVALEAVKDNGTPTPPESEA